MKKIWIPVVFLLVHAAVFAQNKTTLTDSLTKQFSKAWNENNLSKMVSLLQPDAFFKSPYQLRYGRDRMKATVLITNPPAVRDTKTEELYSDVKNDIAWSVGQLTANIYDEKGNNTGKIFKADYTYVFTKRHDENWKLQMMIFHEK